MQTTVQSTGRHTHSGCSQLMYILHHAINADEAHFCSITQLGGTYKARGGDDIIILISAHPRHQSHTATNVLLWPASAALSYYNVARSDDAIRTQQDLAGLRDENFTT